MKFSLAERGTYQTPDDILKQIQGAGTVERDNPDEPDDHVVRTRTDDMPTGKAKPEPEPKEPDVPAVKTFTQEELDRILSDRLNRERAQTAKLLSDERSRIASENKAAQEAEKRKVADEQILRNAYESEKQSWVSMGYDEQIADRQAKKEVARIQHEQEQVRRIDEQGKMIQQFTRIASAGQQKQDALAKRPWAERFFPEADQMCNQYGLDFTVALNQVLGIHAEEVLKEMKDGNTDAVLARVQVRDRAHPGGSSQGGGPSEKGERKIDSDERKFADAFGIPYGEYANARDKAGKFKQTRR